MADWPANGEAPEPAPLFSLPGFAPPPGAAPRWLEAAPPSRSGRLRCALWPAPDDRRQRGTVAVLAGRGEFIEKYYEVIAELLDRGFAVAIMDSRGQGLSRGCGMTEQRVMPVGHVDDFALFDADLALFMEHVRGAGFPPPVIGLGHSMGGHTLLRAQTLGLVRLDALVLTSPMLGIAMSPRRARMVRAMTGGMCRMGLGRTRPPGGRGAEFAGNVLTADQGRFERFQALRAQSPELAARQATWGWLRAAFRSMDALLRPGRLEAITVPVLMVEAGEERLVDRALMHEAAVRLAHCTLVRVDGARHEVLVETDARRREFWRAFDRFVAAL